MKRVAIIIVLVLILAIFTSCIVYNSRITSSVSLKGVGAKIEKDTINVIRKE